MVVAHSGKQFEPVLFAHEFKGVYASEEELVVVEVGGRRVFISSIDEFLEKCVEIDVGYDGKVFESIDDGVGVAGVDAVAKPFLFVGVFSYNIADVDTIVLVLADRVVLQFGARTQPLIDAWEIRGIVRVSFVDFVEIGL